MQALTRFEWNTLWKEIDPLTVGRSMPLGAYADLVRRAKTCWRTTVPQLQGPRADTSNSRWVTHLEDCLERGIDVPPELLADVDPAKDLRFDAPAFPLLCRALTLDLMQKGDLT